MRSHNTLFESNDETGSLHVSIDTERLYIESVSSNCFDDYSALMGKPDVMEKYGDGKIWDVDKTQARVGTWAKRWNENDPFSALAVYKNDDDKFIGHVVLGHGDEAGQSELAYIFDKPIWGKGFAKEAVSAIVNDYTPELVHRGYQIDGHYFKSISATARPDNEASVKILKNVGMHIVREDFKYGHNRYVFFATTEEIVKDYHHDDIKKLNPSH